MKNTYILMCLLLIAGISVQTSAQINPGTANLKHQWTFDDGTAKDYIGGADGSLVGAAVVSGNALNTSSGGYLDLPASTIAINTFPEVTQEIWFTSASGVNGGCNMITYFGNTVGNFGTDYWFLTPAGCSNTRTAISTGRTSNPWEGEDGINATRIDDGKLHHLVSILDAGGISMYVDGVFQSSTAFTGTNSVGSLSTAFAYLCKGGYLGDPTWKGQIHKFSLFNKALNADEVLFLFQKGAEEKQVISTSVSKMVFDNSQPAVMFTVTGKNLQSSITITSPAGIIIDPTTIAANAEDFSITAIWDGSTPVDGIVKLTSGTALVEIPVKSADDSQCFKPLYPDMINLINDPGMNSLANYQGWGAKSVVTILTEPENVYCGGSSIAVGNGNGSCSGSLDILGGAGSVLLPNTTYRVKFMIKTIGGSYQFGVDAGYASPLNFKIDSQEQWKALDTIFTTSSSIGSNIYINSCEGNSGKIAYVDNFELYEYIEPVIDATVKSFVFDPEYTTSKFSVTASNLTSEIMIEAPAGIQLSTNILPAESKGEMVEVIHDGVTPVDGIIKLTSGSYSISIAVKFVTASNLTCFDKLFNDRPNLVPDPYLNNPEQFSGWGGKSLIDIVSDPDSVYCGSHSGKIVGGGSMDVILTGILKPNTPYVARAMVRTIGGSFQLGVWGIDNVNTADVQDTIDTEGQWKHILLRFTTAELGSVQGMFFNNYQRTGKRGFIDNWELYEGEYSAVPRVDNNTTKVYVQNGRIAAELNLDKPSNVEMAIYTLHGALVANEQHNLNAGKSITLMNSKLNSGVYIVKLTVDGQNSYAKVIK